MSDGKEKTPYERFIERVCDSSPAQLLGQKLPFQHDYPIVVAFSEDHAEILFEADKADILDLRNETIVETGDNLELPYKYGLDFLDREDVDVIPAILEAYQRAKAKRG